MLPIIKLDNVRKAFSSNTVLNGINLEIYSGEIFGLIGASGSGKTTFLNALIGFLPTDSGEVLYREDSSEGYRFIPVADNIEETKKRYGVAAQLPSFYSKLTVFENIDFFGSLYGLSREARLTNINTLLELVELENARNIASSNLSGGMQRRLDIACALIHNPDVLILDEPTSDLDPVLSKHIWNLIQKINKRGTTIIVASHHFTDIEQISTRIGVLAKGNLFAGTLHELTGTISKGQEIKVETYPGNYEKVIKHLADPLIQGKEIRGNELVVQTTKPDKVLLKLLNVLKETDETLMDVSVSKLSLSDVFSKVAKK